jgi:UDP:flavonoid glycosyltransferase YjiC (YdhE family)
MRRIMLTWEYGSNLGHLTRLVPLAKRLKEHGHEVLLVVPNVEAARMLVGEAQIPYIPSPRPAVVASQHVRMSSYADLLFAEGWSEQSKLRGSLEAWLEVFRAFKPDAVVMDYSPTASLAARAMKIPRVLIGDGFTLPPATTPLPHMPGLSWATPESAAHAEARVLRVVNAVMKKLHLEPLQALKELFDGERLLLTFPELDQYGARSGVPYLGPLMEPSGGHPTRWPEEGAKRRVVAYLRPQMWDFPAMIEGLALSEAAVVCYAPGAPRELLDRVSNSRILFSDQPVQFAQLFEDADVCFSYGSAGTVTFALLRGVPQVLAPLYLESDLTAQRVESLGAGVMLRRGQTPSSVAAAIHRVADDGQFRSSARAFANKHRDYDAARLLDETVRRIEAVAAG